MGKEKRNAVDRRSFLQAATAAGICLAAPSALTAQEKRPPLPPVPEDIDSLRTNLAE